MAVSSVVESSLKVTLDATPNNYGVTHIAVGALPDDVAWSQAIIVRKYSGYPQNINDGDTINTITNTNYVLRVTAVSTTGAITSASTSTLSSAQLVSTTYIAVASISAGTSIGSGATFTLTSATTAATIVSGGTGYAVDDLVVIPSSSLGGATDTAEPNTYGLTARYHRYDTVGTTTAATTNPGTTAASSSAQTNMPVKAYYSVFVRYVTNWATAANSKWKKAGEVSSILVKNVGTVQVMQDHLPDFYLINSQTSSGNDLVDFLKVFAFQLDIYKTQASNVFYSTNVTSVDETLLKLLLKEFGVSSTEVPDIAQARTLLANLVKIYKESGSVVGLGTLVEAYTGYGADISLGRNLMLDYNSSSFEENTGFWYPKYNATTPPVITHVGPVDGSVAVFTDSASGYNGTGASITGASCATSSTTVTGTFGSDLKTGSVLSTTGTGTGTLAAGTVVTSILSTNTFRINHPPTVALSGATLKASKNMVTGMGKALNGLATGSATFYLGPKKATVTASASATTVVSVLPAVASIDDYVINNSLAVPYGTYVTAVTSTTATLSTAVTLTSGSTLTFSRNAAERVGSQAAWLPVTSGSPYAFSLYLNSAAAITGTATATASATINWYDRYGASVGTAATGTNSTLTVSTSAATATKWVPVIAQGQAPSTAVYAEPTFTINPLTSSSPWYVDAAQFEGALIVVKKEIPTSTTVKLTTEFPHNFQVTRYGITGSNYVTVTGLGAPYDGTFPIAAVTTPTNFTYTISSTSTAAESVVTGGLVASNTPYQDTRLVTVDVLPNRINLVTNPSFEVNTNFWGTNTVASTSAGINCTLAATTAQTLSGSYSMSLTATGTSNVAVRGYAGLMNGAVVDSYVTPFKVTSSTINEASYYTLSFYVKSAVTSRNCYAKIYWFQDEAKTLPSAVTASSTGSTVVTSSSTWNRVVTTQQVPVDANYAVVEININSSVNAEVHYVDDVLFEQGYTVGYYFDGSFDGQSYESERDSVWETGGVANSCRSHLYQNRVKNVGRLKTIITDGLYYA